MAVTYNCQCDCLHCSAADYQEKTRRENSALTFEELKSTIDQTLDLGTTCVVLTAANLSSTRNLRPGRRRRQTPQRLYHLHQRRVPARHTVARLKQAGIYGVFVSLDHFDPERHNTHRQRPGLAEKAYRGLRLCQDAGILTGVSTYATRRT